MDDANQEIRKLAAIMFTDMVGYSAIAQKNESLAIQMLEEHRGLLRPLFPKYGGREIETIGDAFFVEFGSAVEAVRCAVEMQHTLHERNQHHPKENHLRIRIGVHLGDVIQKGSHVLGDGVNIAARLEPLAPPEGICISEDVARQVQNKLDIPLSKLGQRNLKNIQFPMEIYSVNLPWQSGGGFPVATVQNPRRSENQAAKPRPFLWYSLAAVGMVGIVAAYFIFSNRAHVPVEQPTVVRETVRVKEQNLPLQNEERAKPQTLIGHESKPSGKVSTKKNEDAESTMSPRANADSIHQAGINQYRSGNLAAAQSTIAEALSQFRLAQNKIGEADALLATARILKHRDVLGTARAKADEALAAFKATQNAAGVARCQVLLADLLIEEGKPKEAENLAGQVVISSPESDEAFVARALLARAHAALDNMEDALKQAQYFDEHQRRLDDMEWNAVIVATVVRVRTAARAIDRTQRRRQDYESEIMRSGNVPATFEGRLCLGEIALTYGKAPQVGRRRLESLIQDAASQDFRLIVRKAKALLQ
jgi:class 3 adenylate cyclase/tetratricopeptide (TPR) repeat protein